MFDKRFFAALLLSAVLCAACSVDSVSVKPVLVEGTAMTPAFQDGDKILMDESLGELKRGDVVMHLYPKNLSKSYLKRIVGLPGETIEIRNGKVYVNGQILDEPYVLESNNTKQQTFAPEVIAGNNYYVLGDNRDNSSDSRYWGTVSKDLIKARYSMTYSKARE